MGSNGSYLPLAPWLSGSYHPRLAAASEEAARSSTRVIGWYHSHPHITVLPSHVDVQTQAMYQQLVNPANQLSEPASIGFDVGCLAFLQEEGFIGLIFSVFSELPDSTHRMQVVAFQAQPTNGVGPLPAPRPFSIEPPRTSADPRCRLPRPQARSTSSGSSRCR
jgi:hypothetical protein